MKRMRPRQILRCLSLDCDSRPGFFFGRISSTLSLVRSWSAVVWIALACAVAAGEGEASVGGGPQCAPAEESLCATDIGESIPLMISGDSDGEGDGFGGSSCGQGGEGTDDVAFVFTAPHAGPYTFSTAGSRVDTILSVREQGCDGRELACDDGASRGEGTPSELVVELRACQRVTVVVDGHDFWNVGRFSLSITGTEGSCSDSRDGDGDGLVDCDDPDCFGASCEGEPMSWDASWQNLEWQMLTEVNHYRSIGATCGDRSFGPAPALEMNPVLREAARLHSEDMGAQDYFSHTGLDGRSPGQRMRDVGYMGPGPMGENIALGASTAETATRGFMESPGHCEIIMNPAYRVIGIGYVDSGSGARHYWTQNFGGGH